MPGSAGELQRLDTPTEMVGLAAGSRSPSSSSSSTSMSGERHRLPVSSRSPTAPGVLDPAAAAGV